MQEIKRELNEIQVIIISNRRNKRGMVIIRNQGNQNLTEQGNRKKLKQSRMSK